MAGLSIWHILLLLLVIIIVFGTSKLKNLGRDLGGAVKDFKDSVREENDQHLASQNKLVDIAESQPSASPQKQDQN